MIFYFKKSRYALLILIAYSLQTYAQEESWETYVKKVDKHLMEVTVNMDLYFSRPNYKNLLIVATKTRDCYKNGFPKPNGLEDFYTFSDSLAYKIDKLTKNKLAGIITYKCTGFDIYYVKDTTNIRSTLDKTIQRNFAGKKNYLTIKSDRKWQYFSETLLPSDLSNEFFVNHEYLTQLVQSGDALDTPRKINHWFYFNSLKRRTKFIDKSKVLNFSADSLAYKKEKRYPYQVVLSRKDSVAPTNISAITKILRQLSQRYYGKYDGWEMNTILKD